MKFEQIRKKIKNPPAVQNLVRLIQLDDEMKTTKNVVNFALSIPSFNYLSGTKMCVERVSLGLDLDTALKAVAQSGSPAGRAYNADLVRAFFQHDEIRLYSSCPVFDSYHGQYRISRDINVPTSPTFTIIEGGKQIPIVLCGWKDLKLDESQIRMWMTMLESGLFSYGDYRRSPAEVLIFPELSVDNEKERHPQVIRRGDFELFSEAQMREITNMYARAQEAAMPIAEQRWNEREESRRHKEKIDGGYRDPTGDTSGDVSQPDFFAKNTNESS